MVVNPAKTQLMCVTNAINYEVQSYIILGGYDIESSSTMKILGFTMDSRGTMTGQIAAIKKKFAARIWIIRHLKRAKLSTDKLIRIYCALIRPCIEYAQVVYHSMITNTQAKDLERLQSISLKTILGWEKSYTTCLEISGLSSLGDRRREACENFAKKILDNPRFSHWFPENPDAAYNLRHQERFRVDFAHHERLRRAPIYYMRRLLNEMEEPHMNVSYEDLDG